MRMKKSCLHFLLRAGTIAVVCVLFQSCDHSTSHKVALLESRVRDLETAVEKLNKENRQLQGELNRLTSSPKKVTPNGTDKKKTEEPNVTITNTAHEKICGKFLTAIYRKTVGTYVSGGYKYKQRTSPALHFYCDRDRVKTVSFQDVHRIRYKVGGNPTWNILLRNGKTLEVFEKKLVVKSKSGETVETKQGHLYAAYDGIGLHCFRLDGSKEILLERVATVEFGMKAD